MFKQIFYPFLFVAIIISGLTSCLSGENGGYSQAPTPFESDSITINGDTPDFNSIIVVNNDSSWYSSNRGYYKSFEVTEISAAWLGDTLAASTFEGGKLVFSSGFEQTELATIDTDFFAEKKSHSLNVSEEDLEKLANTMNNNKVKAIPFYFQGQLTAGEEIEEGKEPKAPIRVVLNVKVTF